MWRAPTIVETIREIQQKNPDVASADLNAVASYIRNNWSLDEIEYEYLSAKRVNSFGLGDFDTERRSRRLFALHEACKKNFDQ